MRKTSVLLPMICLCVLFMVAQYSDDPGTRNLQQAEEIERYEITKNQETINWNSLIQDTRFSSIQSDRWIVVTTISYPTSDIQFLAQIPGWKVVVVGDTKTPPDWSNQNCVFLSIEDQLQLGYETVLLLPVKSYARKNVGYLFAIAHGAKVIYETDDDNRPLDLLKNFIVDPTMTGLVYDGENVFNPYRHFGQSTLWPRGYPLSSVGEDITASYRLGHWKSPSIQQGIVNGDPDMDAIFRLTRKKKHSVLNVTFDQRAPPAIVPQGVFSPFNSQNTLFLYDALWALLIPTTTTMRVCDIWRGYWAQRLLWEMGGSLGFFPPNAFQKRNSHSYLLDAVEETDLYFQTERLLDFLRDWRCEQEHRFFDCVLKLSRDMNNNGFWQKGDADLTSAWIKDLLSFGYIEPARVPFGSVTEEDSSVQKLQKTNVSFWAAEQTSPQIYETYTRKSGMLSHINDVVATCKENNVAYSANQLNISTLVSSRLTGYSNILLVVVFTAPYYLNLQFMESLYRVYFPNIVYCGENNTRSIFNKAAKQLKSPVTFLEVDIHGGRYGQKCLTEAMKMRYDVDGHLYIEDNIILNTWYLRELPFDSMWLFNITGRRIGPEAIQDAMRNSGYLNKPRFERFSQNLKRTQVGGLYTGLSNLAYVPKKYKDDFVYFMEHFTKQKIFLEVAFPTVLHGLGTYKDIYRIPGAYLLYDANRGYVKHNYDMESGYLYASRIHERIKNFFCKKYLPLTLTLV